MTKEEFLDLAAAYGGEVARWPAHVRDDAALLVLAEPDFAGVALSREAALDAVMDDLPRPVASSALFERIVATAPSPRRVLKLRLWLAPAGLGAALAGVAVAGVLLGVQLGQASSAGAEAGALSVADLDVSAPMGIS